MYVESAMDLGAISADDGGNLGTISGDLGDEIEENSISLEELLWEVDELTRTVTLTVTLALTLTLALALPLAPRRTARVRAAGSAGRCC